ncbi:MAG TPA: hypothetical protein VLV17_05690 [Anaeromyxobacteraceae bacterium]|nr:hypothetical protein [Anaeromyxobacteraceae bacterium]
MARPRPWWARIPVWGEARYLEQLEGENFQQLFALNRELHKLTDALAAPNNPAPEEKEQIESRIRSTQQLREDALDGERVLTTQRQYLILRSTAAATWVAALAAAAALLIEALKK